MTTNSPLIPGFSAEEVRTKIGFCEQLKGGVIMDVVNAEQAAIAQEAGASAVMALERVPSDIRRDGGVARASDPGMIKEIQKAVSIPVMAKVRIGHFVEAQVLEALEVDCIDESEVLTPADEQFHVDKRPFKTPFVCGCRNLGEALRRIHEGAAMIRTKGEAGTGDVVEAVRHIRTVMSSIKELRGADEAMAQVARVPVEQRPLLQRPPHHREEQIEQRQAEQQHRRDERVEPEELRLLRQEPAREFE